MVCCRRKVNRPVTEVVVLLYLQEECSQTLISPEHGQEEMEDVYRWNGDVLRL